MHTDMDSVRRRMKRDWQAASFPDDGEDIEALICDALWSEADVDQQGVDGYLPKREPTAVDLLEQRLREGARFPRREDLERRESR